MDCTTTLSASSDVSWPEIMVAAMFADRANVPISDMLVVLLSGVVLIQPAIDLKYSQVLRLFHPTGLRWLRAVALGLQPLTWHRAVPWTISRSGLQASQSPLSVAVLTWALCAVAVRDVVPAPAVTGRTWKLFHGTLLGWL